MVGEGDWWSGLAQTDGGSRIGSWTGMRNSLGFLVGISRLDRGFGSAAGVLDCGSWIPTVIDESSDSCDGLDWTGHLGSGSGCDRGAGPGETLTVSAA